MLRCILVFALLLDSRALAQNPVWSTPPGSNRRPQEVKRSVTSAYNRWTIHLKTWGLDSTYKHELSLSGRLNTDGWSMGAHYARKIEGLPHKTFFTLLFSEIKDEKQIKQERKNTAFPKLGTGTPFVFGKINNLYTLQLGIGRETMLLPGVLDGNLSVGFRYGGGFSLAMLKPYYLKLLHVDYTGLEPVATVAEEKYSEDNKDLFLLNTAILGACPWEKGLGEVKYIPGLFGDAAFTIEPGKRSGLVKVITLGIQGALYTKELPIMAERKAQRWNGRFYVGLQIGKRWR